VGKDSQASGETYETYLSDKPQSMGAEEGGDCGREIGSAPSGSGWLGEAICACGCL